MLVNIHSVIDLYIDSLLIELAKGPPSAAFCSPFGGGTDTHTHGTDTHTYGTDTQKTCIFGRRRKKVFMLKSFLFVVRSVHK